MQKKGKDHGRLLLGLIPLGLMLLAGVPLLFWAAGDSSRPLAPRLSRPSASYINCSRAVLNTAVLAHPSSPG